MAILDEINPVQAVQCDLCGSKFNRPMKSEALSFSSQWEDVSIRISPNLGKPGTFGMKPSIHIEHTCEECREKFTASVRALIAEMKAIPTPTIQPQHVQ
jgi:hypothetical protein